MRQVTPIQTQLKEANNMVGKYEVYKDKSGKFRWRLTQPSGKVIAKSGAVYPTKTKAVRGIWSALSIINSE